MKKRNNGVKTMENKEVNLYDYPMAMTQQFRHCGNPFRIDTYKGCDFGCQYCFANCRGGNFDTSFKVANMEIINKNFVKAFEKDKETKNLTIELLRNRVPLHLGGLSDPFQKRKFDYGCTYELLKLTPKYNYPVLISTKTGNLPEKYFDVLDKDIHAFQISLISLNNNYIRRFEKNTPSPQERISFIRKLKEKGFWVGIRIQPLIDVKEAYRLVENISGVVDYITVEHIKIGNDNSNKEFLFKSIDLNPEDFVSVGREYELKTEIKRKNIELLKTISKCPIGCGDNDLHELSDSNNCCGIDTINDNFNGWIKYNSMYISKTKDNSQWFPKCNCSACFNSECRKNGYSFKNYVDDYIENPTKVKKAKINTEERQLTIFDFL